MNSTPTRARIANLIWPALLLAMMVALAVVIEAGNCSSKRQPDGCADLGCNADVELWSGLRLFFGPPAVASPTRAAEPNARVAYQSPPVFASRQPARPLTILAVAPKTSPPA